MCVPGNTANSAAASALETPALTGVSPFNGRRKTPPDPICFSKTYGLHLEYCSNRIIAAAVGFLSYRLNVPTADDDVAEHDPRLLDASGAQYRLRPRPEQRIARRQHAGDQMTR